MAEMRAIYFEKGEHKTQYALMIRQDKDWAVYQAIWALHDDEARTLAAKKVEDIQFFLPHHRNSVFTLMKMLSTNGTESM